MFLEWCDGRDWALLPCAATCLECRVPQARGVGHLDKIPSFLRIRPCSILQDNGGPEKLSQGPAGIGNSGLPVALADFGGGADHCLGRLETLGASTLTATLDRALCWGDGRVIFSSRTACCFSPWYSPNQLPLTTDTMFLSEAI